jgi:quercetin dioxygenase-like cupin family protein
MPLVAGVAHAGKGLGAFSTCTRHDPTERAQLLSVHFTPGARTAWHKHPHGQVLHVTEGEGRVQTRGGPVETIRAGDTITFEPDEEHWHGASPTTFMTHLALQEADDEGVPAYWGDHVSDEEPSTSGSRLPSK